MKGKGPDHSDFERLVRKRDKTIKRLESFLAENLINAEEFENCLRMLFSEDPADVKVLDLIIQKYMHIKSKKKWQSFLKLIHIPT